MHAASLAALAALAGQCSCLSVARWRRAPATMSVSYDNDRFAGRYALGKNLPTVRGPARANFPERTRRGRGARAARRPAAAGRERPRERRSSSAAPTQPLDCTAHRARLRSDASGSGATAGPQRAGPPRPGRERPRERRSSSATHAADCQRERERAHAARAAACGRPGARPRPDASTRDARLLGASERARRPRRSRRSRACASSARTATSACWAARLPRS